MATKTPTYTVVQTIRSRGANGAEVIAWTEAVHPAGRQWTTEEINRNQFEVIIR